MTRLVVLALGIASAVALSGCSAPAPLPTPTPTPTQTPTATETFAPTGDGVLRIGTLVSMSGDTASTGPGIVAAVELAVRDINAAGGVLDQPVEVLHRDSGDASQDLLESAFAGLVERGVDVVIGPTSAALVERLAPLAAEAGVTVISPVATAPAVRAVSPAGVFFRTIPADEQQAAAIVQGLADQGDEAVALITTGDARGLSFERGVRSALEQEGMRLSGIEQLDATTNINRLSLSIAGGQPDAVILVTDAPLATATQTAIAALLDRGLRAEQLWFTAQNLDDYSSTVATGLLDGANGVAVGVPATDELVSRLRQSDPALQGVRFAPETYDAVVLAALAAALAGDDGGASVARLLPQAASDGVPCSSFGECVEVLQTEPAIDYQGLSGSLAFDADGELAEAELGLFQYTDENRPERVGTLPLVAR